MKNQGAMCILAATWCMFMLHISYVMSQNPIIVQHGISGSIIEIEANNAQMPTLCSRTFSRKRMWLDLEPIFLLKCWKASLMLQVDADGNGVSPAGLQGFVPDDGIYATSCLDPSDPISCSASKYMRDFFKFLVRNGYEVGKTLDAVAYDWRFSAVDFVKPGNYFSRLKDRVERMFTETGKKVTILGHSMGGATVALFLGTYVTAEWKAKHIRMFISIAGAYGGSLKALKGMIIGNREGIISAETVRNVTRTLPGVHSLIPANTPDSKPFGADTMVRLGTQDYGVGDYSLLYSRVGLSDYANVINKLIGLYQVPPGVETHCIFGYSYQTLSKLTIPDPNNLDNYTEEFTDGDGTLVTASQRVCANFASRQTQPVTTLDVRATHAGLVSNSDVMTDIFVRVNSRTPIPSASFSPPILSVTVLVSVTCLFFL